MSIGLGLGEAFGFANWIQNMAHPERQSFGIYTYINKLHFFITIVVERLSALSAFTIERRGVRCYRRTIIVCNRSISRLGKLQPAGCIQPANSYFSGEINIRDARNEQFVNVIFILVRTSQCLSNSLDLFV